MHDSDAIAVQDGRGARVRVRIFVDGLNFYNNVVRPLNVKWLNISDLLVSKLAIHSELDVELEQLVLFTSMYVGKEKEARQELYHNALQENGDEKFRLVTGRIIKRTTKVRVKQTKELVVADYRIEKKTDAAICVEVINDAHLAHGMEYDVACLVSNDSDMVPVFKMMQTLGKRLIWICPRAVNEVGGKDSVQPNKELEKVVVEENQIISGFTTEDLIRHRLPAKVGIYAPPDRKGWEASQILPSK